MAAGRARQTRIVVDGVQVPADHDKPRLCLFRNGGLQMGGTFMGDPTSISFCDVDKEKPWQSRRSKPRTEAKVKRSFPILLEAQGLDVAEKEI